MPDDLDSLLGISKPDINARLAASLRRPPKGTTYNEPEKIDSKPLPHITEFQKPVGITFLATIFEKQPQQIKRRLAKCPIVGWHKAAGVDQPLYDFKTAIAYLVPPKGNIEDWFGQQNAASLPPFVNKMWWDSAHQRNRVMRSSGQLWHDDDVRLVLGRISMMIRQEVKMWIEDLPEKDLLNDKQYGALVDATNRLVDDVRKALVDMPRETTSMADTIKTELDEAGVSLPDEDE